jgi:hypothetical protein
LFAASDVKAALPSAQEIHFGKADDRRVFSRWKIGNGYGEIRSIKFLAKSLSTATWHAFNR